ncbi:phosphoenolpyruvate carboxykinase (ATP) [Pedobacter endophyticus]|uniref:Phosphoenolpyruvate carboxykinase (ATP) n=1 Tax=Pedobacter endophyticus TaxID=2789740 RepID=A0A7U3SPR3_9SPHI|nr:phosphoenolpyruvate carboxykinase (ATP) [Pedobacter endophyticus]QPH38179.1 phosphoenolpyruvate carboxykinase (ATP) [Pedobacter endophyticus]
MSKKKPQAPDLSYLNLSGNMAVMYQLSPEKLIDEALLNKEGVLATSGALAVDTGKFTGRSPRDKFIVCDSVTEETVWWGDINFKISPERFDGLFNKMTNYLADKKIYVRDCLACANPEYSLSIRVITETAYQNLFANNLFIRPNEDDLGDKPEWTIIAAPGFLAIPEIDGTRQANFSIINFTRKMILIGGTGYTGEIKKGIFSVLNFVLPTYKNTLSMHCSANVGSDGDTAVFFGLSGTGKTTLSADPNRRLIGDDEHGWGNDSVFNFEGGCYAKCVDLSEEKEPQIYKAIKAGALLENVEFFPGTKEVDYSNTAKTENTRVAYPLEHIDNAILPSIGTVPKNIFFLTADAFGVLPPISKLDVEQAMFHFMSGYTAKVAGTETGVTEPQLTFSACFGKAFLPLHPSKYAELLGEKMRKHQVNVWLVNTGWIGGAYGTGKRIKLSYTRAMIAAALNGDLNHHQYKRHHVFKLMMPMHCPGVPSDILDPATTWTNSEEYYMKAYELAYAFEKNFEQFEATSAAKTVGEALKLC